MCSAAKGGDHQHRRKEPKLETPGNLPIKETPAVDAGFEYFGQDRLPKRYPETCPSSKPLVLEFRESGARRGGGTPRQRPNVPQRGRTSGYGTGAHGKNRPLPDLQRSFGQAGQIAGDSGDGGFGPTVCGFVPA